MLSIKDSHSEQFEKKLSESDLFKRAAMDTAAAERAGYSDYSYWGSTVRVFRKNKVAMTMFVVLIFAVATPRNARLQKLRSTLKPRSTVGARNGRRASARSMRWIQPDWRLSQLKRM